MNYLLCSANINRQLTLGPHKVARGKSEVKQRTPSFILTILWHALYSILQLRQFLCYDLVYILFLWSFLLFSTIFSSISIENRQIGSQRNKSPAYRTCTYSIQNANWCISVANSTIISITRAGWLWCKKIHEVKQRALLIGRDIFIKLIVQWGNTDKQNTFQNPVHLGRGPKGFWCCKSDSFNQTLTDIHSLEKTNRFQEL